jgi:hypothetical protein
MGDLERDLRRAFSSGDADPARQETMKQEVSRMFDHRMKIVGTATWVAHIVLVGLLVWGLWMLQRPEMSDKTVGAFVAFVAGATLAVVKLWYWVLHVKYAVLTELKALQVQVAELSEKLPARD